MNLTLKSTFTKVAILTYVLGTSVHIARLVLGQSGDQMPNIAHWIVTILTSFAGLGFFVYRKQIPFKNLFDKIVYWLILVHLISSALMHAYSIIWNTNEWLTVFSYSYSYFAVAYFVIFGYYSFKLDKRLRSI